MNVTMKLTVYYGHEFRYIDDISFKFLTNGSFGW